jgi:hypothetical protein
MALAFTTLGSALAQNPAANSPPVSADLLKFTPKSGTKDGGYVYQLENRSTKQIDKIVLDLEFRDADGVIENRVPSTIQKRLAARAKSKEEADSFFMSEDTRKVTFFVREVTYADGKKWNAREAALAASKPGTLSFVGHDRPASVELVRFRPKSAPKGGVAWRLTNHSNKAIEAFVLDFTYRDGAGKAEKDFPLRVKLGDELAPGSTWEGFENDFLQPETSRGVDLKVRSLNFVGGEKWEAPKDK